MPSLLRPKALGDTVAIAALSGSLADEEVPLLERAIPVVAALGFRVRLAPLVDRERQSSTPMLGRSRSSRVP